MIDSVIISRALQQTSKLTLPNFGTLLKKDNGDIVFTQFMKNDDMVFTSIIMNSYNVPLQDASQMVSEFILNIVTAISKGGSFVIPDVGFLFIDPNGSIKFKKGEPVNVIPQPRQAISPRPIMGVPQQPVQQTQPVQQPYPHANPQFRNQPPYGPRPQGIPQRPQQRSSQRPVTPPPVQRSTQPRPEMRPPMDRRKKVKNNPANHKNDWFLIVAIIVIILVIALILYGTIFTETISDFN